MNVAAGDSTSTQILLGRSLAASASGIFRNAPSHVSINVNVNANVNAANGVAADIYRFLNMPNLSHDTTDATCDDDDDDTCADVDDDNNVDEEEDDSGIVDIVCY